MFDKLLDIVMGTEGKVTLVGVVLVLITRVGGHFFAKITRLEQVVFPADPGDTLLTHNQHDKLSITCRESWENSITLFKVEGQGRLVKLSEDVAEIKEKIAEIDDDHSVHLVRIYDKLEEVQKGLSAVAAIQGVMQHGQQGQRKGDR